MNFLEQLLAEWYGFQGHLVRTNIKFGKRARGGWTGEMDIAAFDPKSRILTHIETSTDADPWQQREKRLRRKFQDAANYFEELFDFEIAEVRRLAIVGFTTPNRPVDLGMEVETMSIPQLMESITTRLVELSPVKAAIPENYPLLRAMQFGAYYGVARRAVSEDHSPRTR